jgi:hypothetical protein
MRALSWQLATVDHHLAPDYQYFLLLGWEDNSKYVYTHKSRKGEAKTISI